MMKKVVLKVYMTEEFDKVLREAHGMKARKNRKGGFETLSAYVVRILSNDIKNTNLLNKRLASEVDHGDEFD